MHYCSFHLVISKSNRKNVYTVALYVMICSKTFVSWLTSFTFSSAFDFFKLSTLIWTGHWPKTHVEQQPSGLGSEFNCYKTLWTARRGDSGFCYEALCKLWGGGGVSSNTVM